MNSFNVVSQYYRINRYDIVATRPSIGLNQCYDFRRILRHDAKRKLRNNEKQSESKSTGIDIPLQTLGIM